MFFRNVLLEVPIVAQWKWIWLVSMRTRVQSLVPLSGWRIRCCRELWYRSQMQVGSGVAVAMAGSCSFNSTPSLETSICHRYGCKREKKKCALNTWWCGGERLTCNFTLSPFHTFSPSVNLWTCLASSPECGSALHPHSIIPLGLGQILPLTGPTPCLDLEELASM